MLPAVRKPCFCRFIIRQAPVHFSAPCINIRLSAHVAHRAQEKNRRPPVLREAADDHVTVLRDDVDLKSASKERFSGLQYRQMKTSSTGVTLSEDPSLHRLPPEAQKPQNRVSRDPENDSTQDSGLEHDHPSSGSIVHPPTSPQEGGTKDICSFTGSVLEERPALPEAEISFDDRMAELRESLATNDPVTLLHCLWKLSHNAEFIAKIPNVTFTELLRNLKLCSNFLPLHLQYKLLGPKPFAELSQSRRGFYATLRDRRSKLQDILQRRLQSGHKFGIGEYAAILNFARATWDGNSARIAMRQMLQAQVELSLKCYNDYFEARCWADTYIPEERHALRVMPLQQKLRERYSERFSMVGDVIQGHQVGEYGLRWEISQLTLKMIEDGIKPDATTYVHLVTALAREGDVTGVKDILDRVWHINVDAVLRGERKPTDIPALRKDSSLYPSENLLFALAHAFGTNNDLKTAMRLVDFFSKAFDIPISQGVRQELLEWAYVLTRPRNGYTGQGGAAAGNLKPRVMQDVWDILTNMHPKTEPSMLMYDKMIRHNWRQCRFRDMIRLMREAVIIFEDHLSKIGQRDKDLESWAFSERELFENSDLGPKTIDMEQERVTDLLTYVTINRWLNLTISKLRWNLAQPLSEERPRINLWQRRLIPDIIREFRNYRARSPIKYTIPRMGRITLKSEIKHIGPNDVHTATIALAAKEVGVIRMIPDTEGPNWIVEDSCKPSGT